MTNIKIRLLVKRCINLNKFFKFKININNNKTLINLKYYFLIVIVSKNENSGFETYNYERNENILCAILALLKELDENSLEVVRRDVEKRLSNFRN
jgi:hypothetical protein